MGTLGHLNHDEPVSLERERIAILAQELGPGAAEEVICRAMEEIALRLQGLAEPHRSGQWAELSRRARALSAIAAPIGMVKLARISGDVAACAARYEAPALGATLARLERVGHRSLAAIWDLQDLGG